MKKKEIKEKKVSPYVFKNADYNTRTFRKIIRETNEEYDEILRKFENRDVDVDYRTVCTIKALRKIPSWKQNLFILYLHYLKPSILAELLKVKPESLSVIIFFIKKDIKSHL